VRRFSFSVGAWLLFGSLTACGGESADSPQEVVEAPPSRAPSTDEPEPGEEGTNGGDDAPLEADAGTEAPPEVPADAAVPPPPEPDAGPALPTCEGEPFEAVYERTRVDETGLHYQGFDEVSAPLNIILVDIADLSGAIGPGFYDLAGTNHRDCEVCVVGLRNCDLTNGGCQKVYYPYEGVVEITELGGEGERFAAKLHGIQFEQVDIDPNSRRSFPVENGDVWCSPEQSIEADILPPAARVGEVVKPFALQNCETEEFVDIHELGAEARALWFVGTAGWCAACAQFVPNAVAAMDQIERDLGPGVLKPVIVLGENADYGRPTLQYCRRYAARYADTADNFFIDHSGVSSFDTTFQYIWPYLGADGSFALPWNALVQGGTFEYFYGDRSGMSDLNTALNQILQAR
jgi:hypothetical protein